MVSREWKNGSNNCTPFLHSLLTKGKLEADETPRGLGKERPLLEPLPATQTARRPRLEEPALSRPGRLGLSGYHDLLVSRPGCRSGSGKFDASTSEVL